LPRRRRAAEYVPPPSDEFPILFIAAAAARGPTTVRGAGARQEGNVPHRRHGPRPRPRSASAVEERPDGLTVTPAGKLHGGAVDSRGDHRIAMSFAVASLLRKPRSEILKYPPRSPRRFPRFSTPRRAVGLEVGGERRKSA